MFHVFVYFLYIYLFSIHLYICYIFMYFPYIHIIIIAYQTFSFIQIFFYFVSRLRKQLELRPTARLHQSLGDCLREKNYRAEAMEHYSKAMT